MNNGSTTREKPRRTTKKRIAGKKTIQKEWLRTREIKELLGIGDSRLYQLIHSNAFPVSRPSGGLIYARRSDIEKFLSDGIAANNS